MANQLIHQIALTLLPDIGDITAKKLIAYCGGVEAVFNESVKNLRKIPGLGSKMIDSIRNKNVMIEAEKELEFITKNKIEILFYLDEKYPKRLKHCTDGPLLLYYKGNADLNSKHVLSIVGMRQPTDYGQEICENIIKQFKGSDMLIISGLAYGIDTCSHRFAIQNELKTVGVLGHGLDRIYPQQNRSLATQMIQQGGLLTEFKKGTLPERQNFPQRNRIVAGMADATLVIESKAKGGSLITAQMAFDYNRDVFAIPGRPKDLSSRGCNNLIKYNIAQLVNSADEIKKILNWETETTNSAPQKQLFVDLNENEQKVVHVMQTNRDNSIDELSIDSGLTMSKTAAILLGLEFKGIVKTLPGKQYRIV